MSTVPERMVNWLFRDTENLSLSFSEWLTLLRATIVIRNREFSENFFNALAEKIRTASTDTELTDFKKDLIIYNALSFIAFADPQDNQKITIKGIEYTIERIPLTSGWLSSTYYAYGLRSTDPDAQSFLIFQGTTTPSDHGFLAGILADTRPHGAVGTQLYSRGQAILQDWVRAEHERTGRRVMCTGQSLGGAMSLHTHIHQPDQVDYFVINPAALTSREQRIYEKNPSIQSRADRTLTVISHVSDPVLALGSLYLPPDTTVYQHGNSDENPIIAHARAPDVRSGARELPSIDRKTSWAWKLIKPVLFFIASLLFIIALPFRLMVKMARTVSGTEHPYHRRDLPVAVRVASTVAATQELSQDNHQAHAVASLWSKAPASNRETPGSDLEQGLDSENSNKPN
jgi:hypothetical protein